MSDKGLFFVNKSLRRFWPEVLQTTKKNDTLTLFYQVIETNREVVELRRDAHTIFSVQDMIRPFWYFKWIAYFLLATSLTVLVLLTRKRKKIEMERTRLK